MKIKIAGAVGGEVTGSAYFVQTERAKVLVDAGMFQGGKESEAKNRLLAGVNLSKLDAVLLTHAHLDHTGRVPLLVKHGLAGRVLATATTIDLAELILQDFARLQAQDAQFIESTYGDRNHRPYSETATEFEELVKQAVEARRRILVPIRCGACPANALSPCDHVPP